MLGYRGTGPALYKYMPTVYLKLVLPVIHTSGHIKIIRTHANTKARLYTNPHKYTNVVHANAHKPSLKHTSICKYRQAYTQTHKYTKILHTNTAKPPH
jgi:hypothetical protein